MGLSLTTCLLSVPDADLENPDLTPVHKEEVGHP